MINIDALNDDEKLAALESIHKSIAESKEIQKKKITTNVELIVKALKKIESDLKQRYDETGQLIANLKNGEDGRDGKDGKDGKNGRDGRDGPVGPRGYDGLPGRNGIDGADGVSITDAHIDFDGSLIISLSSGRVINVGEVVAADIAEKIKVITNGGGTSQGVLDAIASLQAQISAIVSGLSYKGTWNASTNTPTLTSSVGTAGFYYIVSVAGSTNLNGITDWQVGDWAVFSGTVWQKLDQTNLVTSVAGRTGAVVLTTADIGGLGTIATQAASNVAITGGSITGITDLAIADGGTGQSTAAAAITALTGTQTSGYYLRSNGTSASLSAISAGDVPTLNQNTTGTAAGLSATLATSSGGTGLTSFTADGVPYATSTSVLATSGLLKFQATNSALTVAATTTSNGYMGFTNSADGGTQGYIGDAKALITPAINSALAVRGEDAILFGIASTEGMRLNSTGLGIGKTAGSALDVKGTLRLSGSTSGYVGLAPAAAAGSTTYTLPSADGTANQALVTDGSGTLSWASTAVGTVTSVAASVPSFLSISGSPITSSGTLAITLSGTALPTTSGGTNLTSFTANGVVYASSTSALATGSALTFDGTTLGVTGAINATGGITAKSGATGGSIALVTIGTANNTVGGAGNQLIFNYGSNAASRSYKILNDADAFGDFAIYQSTTQTGSTYRTVYSALNDGTSIWSVGGSEQMRLTSTGLGIGTSSFTDKLAVNLSGANSAYFGNNTSGTTSNTVKIHLAPTNAFGTNWSTYEPAYIGAVNNSGGSDTNLVFATYNAGVTSEKMRLDTSGNLGIGTSSPANKLVVSNAGAQGFEFDPTNGILQVYNRSTSAYGEFRPYGSLIRWFTGTSPTEKMRLDSSGNLGLGITPSAWRSGDKVIDIGSTSSLVNAQGSETRIYQNAYVSSGGTNTYKTTAPAAYFGTSSGAFQWFNAPSGTAGNAITFTQAMTLNASGRLGIKQTSPTVDLDVGANDDTVSVLSVRYSTVPSYLSNSFDGTSGLTTLSTNSYNSSNGSASWSSFQNSNYSNAAIQLVSQVTSNGSQIRFLTATAANTNPSEVARIDSSGNLLVGTTNNAPRDFTSGSGGSKLPTPGSPLEIATSDSNCVFINQLGTGSITSLIAFRQKAVGIGSISYNGSSVLYNASSDYRLKNITGALTGYKERLMSLQPKQGTWKADGSEFRGFLAHEFAQPYRASVSGEKDAVDAEGKPVMQAMQASSSEVMADLVALVQEQQAIINSLKARLDAANL